MALTTGTELQKATASQSFFNALASIDDPFAGCVYIKDSTQDTETYTWLGAAPMPTEWVGDRTWKTVPEQSDTVTNKHYSAAVRVDKKLVKYQQWDEVGRLARSLGLKAAAHRIKDLTTLMVAGVSDSVATCWDNQYFYDDDHTDPGAAYTTANDNDLTNASGINYLGIQAGIEASMEAIVGFKDDQGDPWDIIELNNPAAWIVMVPPTMAGDVLKVYTNEVLYSGTDAYTNNLKGMFTPRVNQFLTATDEFYVHYIGGPQKPFILQQSGGIRLSDEININDGHTYYAADYWGRAFYGQYRTSCFNKLT